MLKDNSASVRAHVLTKLKCWLHVLFLQVTVEECVDALSETQWDIHAAIKLVKLGQLLSAALADRQACKRALMSSQWNVDDAAAYLLSQQQQKADV